jgi:hypothetical protein
MSNTEYDKKSGWYDVPMCAAREPPIYPVWPEGDVPPLRLLREIVGSLFWQLLVWTSPTWMEWTWKETPKADHSPLRVGGLSRNEAIRRHEEIAGGDTENAVDRDPSTQNRD